MQIANNKAVKFLEELLQHPMVEELDLIDDQGVKVSIHTYDVLKACYEDIIRNFGSLDSAKKSLDFFAIIVGVIIHDLSKGSIRKEGDETSHSQMMIKNPEYISKESEKILEDIGATLKTYIKPNIIKNISHIVVSHHGKWGKVQPGSREAHIVQKADEYSAKHHRILPIAADKILKLMVEGLTMEEVAEKLGCTVNIVKDRLKRSMVELGIKNAKQLLTYYKKNKKVPLGDAFFEQRVKETEKLIKSVEKRGFKNLILESPLIDFLEDRKIFEREESN